MNARSLIKKFRTDIVVLLLLRWRSSLYRRDSIMLLWKKKLFCSLINISIIFSTHYLLSYCLYGLWGRRYKYSYSQDCELWSNLWFFWVLHKGRFRFYIAHHFCFFITLLIFVRKLSYTWTWPLELNDRSQWSTCDHVM